MNRPITEIINDSDSATDLQKLIDLWNEIVKHKKKYSLVEIRNANNHIRENALKADVIGSDIDKGKFYWHLESMFKSDFNANHLTKTQ